ncbi:rho GTPase-activating protein 19-like isoform X2 [Diabrotica undecimpunctata]|uniref:rho GTPase-activating protein 19-like isoform X2 n=1 Tax=Diabrotica undecimpunctata TaxID=50387 RepID=UPI003B63D379
MNSKNEENEGIIVERFKKDYNEQFFILIRMHLSFLLDAHTDDNDSLPEKSRIKKWNLVPFAKKSKLRGVVEGAPLTQEGICQIFQLIEYLKLEENIKSEGIFRKTGSIERQHELKCLLNHGSTLDVGCGSYSVHDCASVLKGFLQELPEPLLTELHFPVYCQLAELYYINNEIPQEQKLLEALQLLLLLLPPENKLLLKDILHLLHQTASYESQNKMSSDNLAKLFTPHLLCPRSLSPAMLLKVSQPLFGIVSFMIKRFPDMFKVPAKLIVDFRAKYEKKRVLSPVKRLNESTADIASTVFTFVDQERTAKENESNPTETALAQLYAHIQSLPESSKKRKLIKQFNKENGYGTPLQTLKSSKNRSIGDSIKKHIFQKHLARRKGFVVKNSPAGPGFEETMMTPRSRKPVLLLSGTNIHTLPKTDPSNYVMDNVIEEKLETPMPNFQTNPPVKSKSEGDINKDTKVDVPKMNKSESDAILSDTFKEYLSNRDIVTIYSPQDSSFSSRTDDFTSTEYTEGQLTESLLYCLDGNNPDGSVEEEEEEKKLVLKPKQFDENGKPIIFETSF